jgi:hypothetical protein
MSGGKQKVRAGWGWRRWLVVGGLAGSVFASVWWWSGDAWSQQGTRAAPPAASSPIPQAMPPAPAVSPEYANRVVAYVHGNVPVTREMLGEYLIARYGADKVELMVNKLIIDEACKAQGIDVTAAEVEAQLDDDLKGMSLDRKQFVDAYLKQHHVNLFEWCQDVVKPKLQLGRMAAVRVHPTEDEVRMAYDALYGEKVQMQIILWPQDAKKQAMTDYAALRDDPEAFNARAKSQASSQLAATGGLIKEPVGRHATGCTEEFEKDLFSLQPGEITQLHEEPQGLVVAKCVKRVPPQTSVSLESVRPALVKEVMKRKAELEIPKVFAELRQKAAPVFLLKPPTQVQDLGREAKEELKEIDRVLGPMSAPQPGGGPGRNLPPH